MRFEPLEGRLLLATYVVDTTADFVALPLVVRDPQGNPVTLPLGKKARSNVSRSTSSRIPAHTIACR